MRILIGVLLLLCAAWVFNNVYKLEIYEKSTLSALPKDNKPCFISEPDRSLSKREDQCIAQYVNEVARIIQPYPFGKKMRKNLFNFFVFGAKMPRSACTSNRSIIINVGPGTTGTKTLHKTLEWIFHMISKHWFRNDPQFEGYDFKGNGTIAENFTSCYEHYDAINFTYRTEDVIMDSPVSSHFWEFYLSYPNARFILTTRDPSEYIESRIRNHGKSVSPIIPRPCGLLMNNSFSILDNEKLFTLHQEFVRCLIPKNELLDICIVCGNTTYGMVADWLNVEVPEGYQHERALETVDSLKKLLKSTKVKKETLQRSKQKNVPLFSIAYNHDEIFLNNKNEDSWKKCFERTNMTTTPRNYMFETEKVDVPRIQSFMVCISIIYGEVDLEKIKFFSKYYKTMGAAKLYGFYDPVWSQEQIQKLISIEGTEFNAWNKEFPVNNCKDEFRPEKREGYKMCADHAKNENIDWVLAIDGDEFLYYNGKPENFRKFLSGVDDGISQISFFRYWYTIDVCRGAYSETKKKQGSICDAPYFFSNMKKPKSIYRAKDFIDCTSCAHWGIVQNLTLIATPEFMHLKHWRGITSKEMCTTFSFLKEVKFQPPKDLTDPCKKDTYNQRVTFKFDSDLEKWCEKEIFFIYLKR